MPWQYSRSVLMCVAENLPAFIVSVQGHYLVYFMALAIKAFTFNKLVLNVLSHIIYNTC